MRLLKTATALDRLRWRVGLHPALLPWALFALWETLGVRLAFGTGLAPAGLLDDLGLAALLLAAFAAAERLPRVPRALLSAALAAAVAAFVLATALYFSFFRTFLNADSFFEIGQLPETSASLRTLLGAETIVVALLVPLALAALALLRGAGYGPRRAGLPAALFAALALPSFSVAALVRSPAFSTAENDPLSLVARQAVERAAGTFLEDDAAARRRIAADYRETWNAAPGYRLAGGADYPLLRVPDAPPPKGIGVHNVVVVLMESVRDWETGLGTDLPSVTPNLKALSAQGLTFEPFYGNGSQTVRGEVATLCSVLPNVGGAQIYGRYPYASLRCLPEILEEKGYETHWISSYTASYGNKYEFLTAHGVEHVHDRDELLRRPLRRPHMGWGPSDEDLMDFAVDVLDRSKKPFFAEIMTLSNHHPFDEVFGIPPQQVYDTRGEKPVYRHYLNGIHYTDYAIGHLMELARTRPWFDDTLFVFLGDHGQWHFPRRTRAPFPAKRVEAYYRLPLVMVAPGHLAPGVRAGVGSQIDVAPTILDLLGLAAPNAFMGVSLLADLPPARRYAFMGDENGWSLRVGDAYCYLVGQSCFEDTPPRCPEGVSSLPRPHACFTFGGDLLDAGVDDVLPLLPPAEAEAIVARGLRLKEAEGVLLRTDSLYPRGKR